MIMDDPACCQGFARWLRAHRHGSCEIVVDKSHFEAKTSRYQRPRLLELKQQGARVVLGEGFDTTHLFGPSGKKGIMHMKGVIIDGRVAFTGGGNLTKAARGNRELFFRITGPQVAQIAQGVSAALRSGEDL